MSRISEIREVKNLNIPPGILLYKVPLLNRDETKCVIILLKQLMLCSLEFSIELPSFSNYAKRGEQLRQSNFRRELGDFVRVSLTNFNKIHFSLTI